MTKHMHQPIMAALVQPCSFSLFWFIIIVRVDTPGDSFTNVVLQAMDLALYWVSVRKPEFPCWFFHSLRYCIQKKNYFYRWYRKIKTEYYYSKYFHYQKLVKITIKSDRLNWCARV